MAVSAVTICSNALLMLGDKPISSFDEQTDAARLAANLWPTVRDMLLRSHPWNCAIRRVVLAPSADAPLFGYSAQFLLPSDFVRLLDIHEVTDYQLESGAVLANATALKIRYVWRNEQCETWDAQLIHCATELMRTAFAYPITEKTTLDEYLSAKLERLLKRARAIDGQENPPETLGSESLYLAGF